MPARPSVALIVTLLVLSALSMTKGERATAKIAEIAGTADNVRVRREAMNALSRRDPQQAINVLIKLYGTEKNDEVKSEIITALARLAPKPVAGQADQDAATRKIADIARNDPNPQLRETAIYVMVRRLGPGDQAVATVIQFYDAEKSEPMKERLLSILGRSTNKAALRKLMEVAKSDSSLNLRKAAVTYLGRSKDPEAQKFIEEILK